MPLRAASAAAGGLGVNDDARVGFSPDTRKWRDSACTRTREPPATRTRTDPSAWTAAAVRLTGVGVGSSTASLMVMCTGVGRPSPRSWYSPAGRFPTLRNPSLSTLTWDVNVAHTELFTKLCSATADVARSVTVDGTRACTFSPGAA